MIMKIILLITILSLVGCGTTEVSTWPTSNQTVIVEGGVSFVLPYSEADNIQADQEIKEMYSSHGLRDPKDWSDK